MTRLLKPIINSLSNASCNYNKINPVKQKCLFNKAVQWSLSEDFSLRSQTFCFTADFFTTFYICLKPRLFAHPITKCLKPRLFSTSHHKIISKHPRIQESWLYFAKKNFEMSDKNGKSAFTQLALPVPGQAYSLR